MTSEKIKNISFGRYLKSVRIEKGIDLRKIAKETKISQSILVNLENENHEKLPGPLFVKGFIQGYAEIVGADAILAGKNYMVSLEKHKKTFMPESELSKRKSVSRYHLSVCFSLLTCIIILSVYLMSGADDTSMKKVHQQTADSKKNMKISTDAAPHETMPKKTENLATDILTLAVSAVEKTWLKIIIDDQSPQEYLLEPGDHLELESSTKFNILVGNAAGVKLMFNNKPVKVFGKNGQVVTMQLP
ncbi:MAG: DUF4115 domain-containing protein [Deltaproteobacteria bacterium]|nr:DUF4115 domain-containing protein [Deltaproteobacteria bacterium]MBW2218333.1 DUF4115 domain-containing protein [Deltaproteobacteria bacterium]